MSLMANNRSRSRARQAARTAADDTPNPYLGSAIIDIEPTVTGAIRTFRRPGDADLADVQRSVLRELTDAQERRPRLLAEISACASDADPLLLYSRLVTLAGMRRIMPGPTVFGLDAVLEFYGGLVTAMQPDEVVARLGSDDSPQSLYEMDNLLREYAIAERRVGDGQVLLKGASDSQAGTRHLLDFEQRFDRMLGYPAQLRPIFTSITDPLEDKSRAALGFSLGDALMAADAYGSVLTERRLRAAQECENAFGSIPRDVDRNTLVWHLACRTGALATFGSAPVEEDLVGVIVERAGLASAEVARLVAALTTHLGSQQELTGMHDTNTLRRRSIIALPDGRCLWAVPDDFIHVALDWAAEVCQREPLMIKSFDRERQTACERLTQQALAGIFGEDDVHAAVTYPGDGRPDIDVLVASRGCSLVVEARGGGTIYRPSTPRSA
ncbi:hypothetical protein [Fodinicola feengrottensis]|uniref:hypothetical protein n=1 Tax=Fodinicola feengrottensis TaxID=435914 RepID=UPI002440F132|nr:hypothetical protein [Fodinicola feengrottensis]